MVLSRVIQMDLMKGFVRERWKEPWTGQSKVDCLMVKL